MHVLLGEVDSGREFYVKIPVVDSLYCRVSLCGGSMTTCYLKVYLNNDGFQQPVVGFRTLHK